MQIIDDVLNGLENKNAVKVFVDRTEAVHYALDLAHKGDCVLLLGKGHENYQIIGTEKIPYSDRDAAESYLREKFRKS
jgi:UDP-N-acetylmuramoyl-L-alanyl-D-glutamate--2,6-diaminopimelate ligase